MAGRTTSTSSRLLYDVIGAIYDWVGFDVVDDAVFRDLVIARIVERTSKVDSGRVLADLGADTVSYRTIQRHLAKVDTGGYRDAIAAKCFTHAADRGGLSLLLYDVTTLYLEAENEDDLRKVGYSKERRVDPQIVVGLLVDRTGFPNTKVNDTTKRAEPVWNAEHTGAWRAIWAYSAKRARRDQKTLHAQEARAKAVINGERAAKSTRFVKTHAGDRAVGGCAW